MWLDGLASNVILMCASCASLILKQLLSLQRVSLSVLEAMKFSQHQEKEINTPVTAVNIVALMILSLSVSVPMKHVQAVYALSAQKEYLKESSKNILFF
jgi:hypothetical protein